MDANRKRNRSPSPSGGADDDGAGERADLPTSPAASLPRSSPPPASGQQRAFLEDDDDDDGIGSEVEEENEIADDMDDPMEDEDDEEGDGIDLFGSDMDRDYRGNDALDNYNLSDLDEAQYEGMDGRARARAEAEMRRRDMLEGRIVPVAFLDPQEGDDGQFRPRRRRRAYEETTFPDDEDDAARDAAITFETLEDLKGLSVAQWLAMERPRQVVGILFKAFLMQHIDEHGRSVYGERIRIMCEANGESLEVSYKHLSDENAALAYLVTEAPASLLPLLDEMAVKAVQISFPEYPRIHPDIHVRITDIPTCTSLRDLRQAELNKLVRVCGVVTRRTGVFPQLRYVKYDCVKCGSIIGPFHQDAANEIRVKQCPSCMGKGPFTVNSEQTVYRNYQKLTLQESPGTVPAGRLPRHKEVILLWDLIDSARPGEEIEVIGVYRNNFDTALNTKNGFPVFATIIEANHISKSHDLFASFRLTTDDVNQIRRAAQDPRIGQRIMKSIAPSIYGHEDIKAAIALSMFGGVTKNVQGKHRIRGDINILLLGDPGTAKSQFLKYVEKTSHRAVFTTGQGASAVGLTASVRKDPITREWSLEGGALVLADKGVCLIDEFDKMNDADRTSIHEAMEQQSISISKAGIVTTLHARCAIMAAANPIRGRYNAQIPFSQNVDLTEPILSRFDVLCVVKDKIDPQMDELLAKFVVESHIRSHPLQVKQALENPEGATSISQNGFQDEEILSQDFLKKYLMYAKDKVHPKLHQMDEDKISKLYSELRRESLATGSIPITVRHLESVIRMAEAHARMHLRDYVRSDDIDMAIRVTLESFISAQKFSVMRQLRKSFAKYIHYMRDNDELLYFVLSDLLRDHVRLYQLKNRGVMPSRIELDAEEFEAKARELNIHNVRPFFSSPLFRNNNFALDAARRKIVKSL
ncbi:MCM DNA helicase complex subunit [Sorochytrium milnesiophthora]